MFIRNCSEFQLGMYFVGQFLSDVVKKINKNNNKFLYVEQRLYLEKIKY